MTAQAELIDWIRHDHQNMGQAVELLDRYLFHLRFEGKHHQQQNLNRIREHLEFLEKDMDRRMSYEEKILFPFLARHIPRVKPLIHMLCWDHENCRREFNYLTTDYPSKDASEILDHGDYLVNLLKSHCSIEDKGAIALLQSELKSHEKKHLRSVWDALQGESG